MKKELRIIYMGTPEFAVPSLEVLVENGYNIVAVITAPDRPAGRGLKLKMSPVKECAVKYNIPVLQPEKLKDDFFLSELAAFRANLQIVVAFRMLPEAVWNMPEIGTFNLHASLLPQYRGAAPINWAVINGEKETGCTTFFLKHEIDTGDILLQEKELIAPEDNVGDVYSRLMDKGSQLVLNTVQQIESDSINPFPQDESRQLKPAPKLFKTTCKIDWKNPSITIHNLIRGLSPYPAAWTTIDGKNCKIYKSSISPTKMNKQIESDNKTFLRFKTGDGALDILELQLEGKKRMDIESFLRGYKLEASRL